MDFSRLLSGFPVLFEADLIFKDFSRKPSKFKYFSSLCVPCYHRRARVKVGKLGNLNNPDFCHFFLNK